MSLPNQALPLQENRLRYLNNVLTPCLTVFYVKHMFQIFTIKYNILNVRLIAHKIGKNYLKAVLILARRFGSSP
jgi:hypothetical protein